MRPLPSSRNEAGSGTAKSMTRCRAAVQHTDRKGGVARIRFHYDLRWRRGKRCIDQLDQVVWRDRCHEEPAFASRWLEGLHEVADAADFGVRGAKGERPETSVPVASVMSSCVPVGPVLENPTPDSVELAAPSLLPGSNISATCPLQVVIGVRRANSLGLRLHRQIQAVRTCRAWRPIEAGRGDRRPPLSVKPVICSRKWTV